MKPFVTILGVLCLATVAAMIYAKRTNIAQPAPVVETVPPPAPAAAAKPYSPHAASNLAVHTGRDPSAASTAHRHASNSSGDPAKDALQRSIHMLVSRTTSFKEKQEMWKQLREAGQLDDVIEALKQGVKDNPDSAEYQAALGEANLQKAGEVSKNGGAMNELGILGMTADQSFDAALKIDPQNWDAQFFKAVSMSYWPAELNKGDEVLQRFSNLINQQANQPEQPEFALPYVALGQEYQKLGQSDNALQTWQAGAAKFPNDNTLQQKITAATQP
jgi:tetratricopeptide (TPR) repeat protein